MQPQRIFKTQDQNRAHWPKNVHVEEGSPSCHAASTCQQETALRCRTAQQIEWGFGTARYDNYGDQKTEDRATVANIYKDPQVRQSLHCTAGAVTRAFKESDGHFCYHCILSKASLFYHIAHVRIHISHEHREQAIPTYPSSSGSSNHLQISPKYH